jgi:hypothetical protein
MNLYEAEVRSQLNDAQDALAKVASAAEEAGYGSEFFEQLAEIRDAIYAFRKRMEV